MLQKPLIKEKFQKSYNFQNEYFTIAMLCSYYVYYYVVFLNKSSKLVNMFI